MQENVRIGDVTFNCYRTGSGPALIFVHCSGGSHKEWRFALEDCSRDFHVIAPDLFGYGANPPWTSPTNPHSVDDLELLATLIPEEGPYHLVGHSCGAVLALETARQAFSGAFQVPQSLFLIEPPATYLLRDSHHWQKFQRLKAKCLTAVNHNNLTQAARTFMGFWIGHLPWFFAPRWQKQRMASAMTKIAYELAILDSVSHRFDDHRIVDCPVTLISGSRSPAIVRALNQHLQTHLPNARHFTIKGAGHMSPYTHPQAVKRLLDEHLGWVGG